MTSAPRMLRAHYTANDISNNSRALRIISERSSKGETRDLLLEDLTSKDKNRRSKALNAMHFLVSNRACMPIPSSKSDVPLMAHKNSITHLHLHPAQRPTNLHCTRRLRLSLPRRTRGGNLHDNIANPPKNPSPRRTESPEHHQLSPTREYTSRIGSRDCQPLALQVPVSVRADGTIPETGCGYSHEDLVV